MAESVDSNLVLFNQGDGPKIETIPMYGTGPDGCKLFVGVRIDQSAISRNDDYIDDICVRLIALAAHLKRRYGVNRVYDAEYL